MKCHDSIASKIQVTWLKSSKITSLHCLVKCPMYCMWQMKIIQLNIQMEIDFWQRSLNIPYVNIPPLNTSTHIQLFAYQWPKKNVNFCRQTTHIRLRWTPLIMSLTPVCDSLLCVTRTERVDSESNCNRLNAHQSPHKTKRNCIRFLKELGSFKSSSRNWDELFESLDLKILSRIGDYL